MTSPPLVLHLSLYTKQETTTALSRQRMVRGRAPVTQARQSLTHLPPGQGPLGMGGKRGGRHRTRECSLLPASPGGTEKSRRRSGSPAPWEPPPGWRRSFQPDTLSRPTPQPKGYNRRGRGSVEVSQNNLQPDSSSLKVHGGGHQEKLQGLGLIYLGARPRLLGAGEGWPG